MLCNPMLYNDNLICDWIEYWTLFSSVKFRHKFTRLVCHFQQEANVLLQRHGKASINHLVYLKLAHKDSQLLQSINRNTALNYRSCIRFLLAINFPIGMLVVMRYRSESLFALIQMLLKLKHSLVNEEPIERIFTGWIYEGETHTGLGWSLNW